MAAIAAHFRYISRNGQRPFEDDRGVVREGKEALRDLAEQWRHGGSFIDETSPRREAFNIMLSMPRGTDPLSVQRAAREFAQAELGDHRYVMVLHDHQANPHVHISVRAESRHGKRLNPRKADLQRWRETFAERLRGWGIEAEATRQATRGACATTRRSGASRLAQRGGCKPIGRRRGQAPASRGARPLRCRRGPASSDGLSRSESAEDRALAAKVDRYVHTTPFAVDFMQRRDKAREQQHTLQVDRVDSRVRRGPEIER